MPSLPSSSSSSLLTSLFYYPCHFCHHRHQPPYFSFWFNIKLVTSPTLTIAMNVGQEEKNLKLVKNLYKRLQNLFFVDFGNHIRCKIA